MILERSRELAVIETLDGGKPIRESRDVDVPLAIERVREMNLDPRQLTMLLFQEAEPQPVPGHEEATVPVDVEALLRIPA